MSDDVRRLSDELARDPSSLVFLPLGEALRRRGELELAYKVAVRGLERHPHNADAHDLLARIAVARGQLQRAFDEWDMVLRLSPGHVGALKGMGFICFNESRLEEAERYLGEAAALDGEDASIAAALERVRVEGRGSRGEGASHHASPRGTPPKHQDPLASTDSRHPNDAASIEGSRPSTPDPRPSDARTLFAEVLGDGEQTALLLDAAGLVLAGAYVVADGHDIAQEIGAELSGVSDEARRAMRHLGLGEWSSIVFETQLAIVAMAPAPNDALLLVAADRATPLGFVRRLLDRAAACARQWMAAVGA